MRFLPTTSDPILNVGVISYGDASTFLVKMLFDLDKSISAKTVAINAPMLLKVSVFVWKVIDAVIEPRFQLPDHIRIRTSNNNQMLPNQAGWMKPGVHSFLERNYFAFSCSLPPSRSCLSELRQSWSSDARENWMESWVSHELAESVIEL